MKCPVCGGKLATIDVRTTGINSASVKRTRMCADCLTRFPTTEKINYEKLSVYIKDKIHNKIEGVGL